MWTKTDSGAWDGPKKDWEKTHKKQLDLVKHKRVVLQAGGNHGVYPRLLSDHFEQVYTFEPDALNFYCLTRNCQKDNIFKFQAALGNKHFTTELTRRHMRNTGQHSVDENSFGYIPVLKVDDFFFHYLDMIWLDVEGYEYKVLCGAENTIKAHRPVVMAERGNHKDIRDFLRPLGYTETTKSASDTVWLPRECLKAC